VATVTGTSGTTSRGPTAHYIYGTGLIGQVTPTGSTVFYDFNNVGSTVGITGSSGDYVNKYAYLPFGQTVVVGSAVPNVFTFWVRAASQQQQTEGYSPPIDGPRVQIE
jgi:hypothetical protein